MLTDNHRTDPARILIVEDDREIRKLIAITLSRQGFELCEAGTFSDAVTSFKAFKPHLAIVDQMLPDSSGLGFPKATESACPMLMITAKISEGDIVQGLDAGFDDYLTKPFEVAVLLARVRALLRRTKSTEAHPPKLRIGNLEVDQETREVSCSGNNIHTTTSEFNLLVILLSAGPKVLSRQALIAGIQGDDIHVTPRSIDNHILELRKKLGPCAGLIRTVRGIGYRVSE